MFEKINAEIVLAMKSGDKFKLSVLRMLKSALQNEAINKKKELEDEEVISVIKKQVKMRKESMLEFEKYEKFDDANKLKEELNILNVYLPEELSEEEVISKIDEMFAQLKPEGIKDMGRCMKYASENIKNADMSLVSKLIKEKLN